MVLVADKDMTFDMTPEVILLDVSISQKKQI